MAESESLAVEPLNSGEEGAVAAAAETEPPAEEGIITKEILLQDISHLQQFLDYLPQDHPNRAVCMVDLALFLGMRFSERDVQPDMGDMFEAIRLAHAAIDSLPQNNPRRPRWTEGFELVLGDRFSHGQGASDIQDDPLDDSSYIQDCGPGELGSRLPPPRRPLGCGRRNLPYNVDGALSFIDIMSGVFDRNGRWSYRPMERGIFTSGVRRIDVGTYNYAPRDFIYNDEYGTPHVISAPEANLRHHRRILGIDTWLYLADTIPKRLFHEENSTKAQSSPESKLCDECRVIDLQNTVVCLTPDAGEDLAAAAENKSPRPEKTAESALEDVGSYAEIDDETDAESDVESESSRSGSEESEVVIRLSEDARSDAEGESSLPWGKEPGLFPGLPAFLDSGSPEHFSLIKEWIRLCDEGKCGHPAGCAPKSSSDEQPSRFIRVGGSAGSAADVVHLVATDSITTGHGDVSYIALSHCWGSHPNGRPPWSTTRENANERLAQGISVSSLPANFQDAIHVTRALGKEEDWLSEGKKMAGIFRNANCVIAASSAAGSTDGFLRRPRSPGNSVFVPQSSRGPVYFCEDVDDFSGDVGRAVLDSRAWVFQERALARRTIHFTKRQTYWECGGGVRCESLTYMRNEGKASLLSDPDFPSSPKDRALVTKIQLFTTLFETYAQLDITQQSDRPIAIYALAQELGRALDTNIRYGVFDRALHRGLLWRRAQEASLEQIAFEADSQIPSWSWMAYTRPIKFAEISQLLEWDDTVKVDAAGSMAARHVRLQINPEAYRIHDDGLCNRIIDPTSQEEHLTGEMWVDKPGHMAVSDIQDAVVLGRQAEQQEVMGIPIKHPGTLLGDRRKYVLLLVEEREWGHFERLGIALVERRLIRAEESRGLVQVQIHRRILEFALESGSNGPPGRSADEVVAESELSPEWGRSHPGADEFSRWVQLGRIR
ncbi:hypothetical protein CSAL01_03611 [Colletotrichum salicis]|uniref:Heterokaryon incompatibility domain-containing protein n=1 Tax=Colletotrichum salicis TaxID=1209931 RepID=A0A135U031_9PEZI|nr:hypothetical protein CSAL01_03611 [Colletotrichum salicis]